LDDTLYDYEYAHRNGLQGAYKEWISQRPYDNFDKFIDFYDRSRIWVKRFLPDTASSHSRALYFQKVVESVFRQPNTDIIIKLFDAYYRSFYDNLKLFTDVKEILTKLKQENYQIVLITNMLSETQYRKLSILGLGAIFDHIVTSEAVEHEKPHPHIFSHTLTLTNSKAEESVMVGDSFTNDVEPSSWLGMTAIWFNPKSKAQPFKIRSHFYSITHFEEILEILEKLKM
jgi:putative hydrolase of the HAD superfamily